MENDRSAQSEAGTLKTPGYDPMDTSGEEEEGDEDLLKKADSMLDSPAGAPSSHQELSDNNTGPHTNKRPDSVSSLVSNLKITAFQGVPVPLEKNSETPARIQSDPSTVTKLSPEESLDLNKESAEKKLADSDSGSGTGTGSGSGTGPKSTSMGAVVDTVTGRQIGTGTGVENDTGL
jgi:hypothetical protein